MINDEPLWVVGCPLCEIFLNKDIKTKLYWPHDIDSIGTSEFIIIDYQKENKPIIIYRDHVGTILNETWGSMLYRCRRIFGDSMKLKWTTCIAKDHFYCEIKI